MQERESLRDLQLELETAYLLLRERSLSLVYEPGHPERGRSPDFAVNFTTSLTFMVEVTRLRADQKSTRAEAEGQTAAASASLATPLIGERLADTIGSKLGQLLPQRSNLLLVGVEATRLTHEEFHASMLRMQQRAEGNDPAVVQRHGFRDRSDFFQNHQRLGALLVRGGTPLQAGEPVLL